MGDEKQGETQHKTLKGTGGDFGVSLWVPPIRTFHDPVIKQPEPQHPSVQDDTSKPRPLITDTEPGLSKVGFKELLCLFSPGRPEFLSAPPVLGHTPSQTNGVISAGRREHKWAAHKYPLLLHGKQECLQEYARGL